MIRLGTFVWLALLTMIGVGLYQVELGVLAKESELRQINRQIDANRDATHVLEAEWSYLNDPTRLADLARRYTDLAPATPTQIAGFDRLLPRPPAGQPFERGLHEGGAAGAAALLASMKGSEPDGAGSKAATAATFSTATASEADEKSPAKPTDEQAEADDVINAILADMKKAQE
ncbi:cell division protein FtsL [Dongia sp. agr-C8]